jgi:tetratricopeptide (TPR) repeat protein
MQKYTKRSIVLGCFAAASLVIFAGTTYGQEDYKAKYDKLKRDYDSVTSDRDNILLQAKGLVEFKSKCMNAEENIKKAADARESALSDLKKTKEQSDILVDKINTLQAVNAGLTKERDELKKSLDKMTYDLKIVPETQRENSRLRTDNASLQRDLKNLQMKTKRIEEQQISDAAQIEVQRRQIKEFKKRYEQSMAKNRSLEKKIEQVPTRFAEVARENKILIKETALMHYNLGVFYTKNKEFSRAIAEFEKDIELNPDDAAAHYNLGFIYAEYLVNRPLAIQHFRKFLSLVKSDDKDADWVKKYILTWQTWEGKKQIE